MVQLVGKILERWVPWHERNVAKHSSGKGEEAGGTRLVEQGRDETKTRNLPEVQRELGTGRGFGRRAGAEKETDCSNQKWSKSI